MRGKLRASCLVVTLLAACSVATDDQPFPPLDAQTFAFVGAVLPLPTAQLQPLSPTIRLLLSDLPDPATVQFPALQLGPRGHSVEFLLETSLVERQLTLRPRSSLLPETDYFVRLTQDLRALSGQRLQQAVAVAFHTGNFVQPAEVAPAAVTLGQVLGGASGLRARCATAGCHSSRDQNGGTTGLAAADLDFSASDAAVQAQLTSRVGRGSIEGLLLVQPGVPEQSYLLRKLVATTGFARISGDPMPPGGPPVDAVVLRSLELWIRQGAH